MRLEIFRATALADFRLILVKLFVQPKIETTFEGTKFFRGKHKSRKKFAWRKLIANQSLAFQLITGKHCPAWYQNMHKR